MKNLEKKLSVLGLGRLECGLPIVSHTCALFPVFCRRLIFISYAALIHIAGSSDQSKMEVVQDDKTDVISPIASRNRSKTQDLGLENASFKRISTRRSP